MLGKVGVLFVRWAQHHKDGGHPCDSNAPSSAAFAAFASQRAPASLASDLVALCWQKNYSAKQSYSRQAAQALASILHTSRLLMVATAWQGLAVPAITNVFFPGDPYSSQDGLKSSRDCCRGVGACICTTAWSFKATCLCTHAHVHHHEMDHLRAHGPSVSDCPLEITAAFAQAVPLRRGNRNT